MKKFNTILAIAAVALMSVSGLSSCEKNRDYEDALNSKKEVKVKKYDKSKYPTVPNYQMKKAHRVNANAETVDTQVK